MASVLNEPTSDEDFLCCVCYRSVPQNTDDKIKIIQCHCGVQYTVDFIRWIMDNRAANYGYKKLLRRDGMTIVMRDGILAGIERI